MRALFALSVFLVVLVASSLVSTGESEPSVDFVHDIRPIFEQHCYECHGDEKREGGLRLTNRRDAFTPGDLGISAIEPGASDLSPLFELISSSNDEERMPREGPALTADQIDKIRRWIDDGATWPEDDDPAARHWAYHAPKRPRLPIVQQASWPRNEIDYFILARQEAAGVEPNPRAEPARLMRRLYLDLIGLPPTPEQVDAFVDDPSEAAYARTVDELLASPRYGERWAVHWLDLARYADSNGFQTDRIYEAWPYRDWVIDAFNRDMPFNRFTVEQLAGDLMPRSRLSQRIATGFHRSAPTSIEAGVDPEEDRVRQVVDRVNVTTTVWLGSTLECAQCHNHKYDPFSQQEYYELFAFFNNTPIEVGPLGKAENPVAWVLKGPTVAVPLTADQQARRTALAASIRSERTRLDALDADRDFDRWKRETRMALANPVQWTPADIVRFVSSADEGHRVLADKSLSVEGVVPDAVAHAIELSPSQLPMTALRVEILPRVGGEPPRGTEERQSVFVSELSVTPASEGEEPLPPLEFWMPRHAKGARRMIDGRTGKGWRIKDRRLPEQAVLIVDGPPADVNALSVVMEQQYGQGATIDRIRFSTTSAPPDLVALSEDVALLLRKEERSSEEDQRLRKYYDTEGRFAGTELPRLRRANARLRQARARVLEELPEPRTTHLLKRGDFRDLGPPVSPTTPAVFHRYPETFPRNRLGLALWLVDPANPLVGRVTVNRWWAEFFGQGLVRTPGDFGSRGDPPTHPDLLDWLAVEFVEGGWSMKDLHRRIVLSATYQQSSRRSEQHEQDPSNVLYARSQRRRLPAELLRDNALAMSGLLNVKMGGPPVYPPQPAGVWRHDGNLAEDRYRSQSGGERFRRGVYVVWRRSAPYPSFVTFDAPDRTTCTTRRASTNTPLQALVLMNDQAFVEMAAGLAERILREQTIETNEERVAFALRLAVARAPRPADVEDLMALLGRERRRFEQNPDAALRLTENARWGRQGDEIDPVEFAAWFSVANVLLNLDETITRS